MAGGAALAQQNVFVVNTAAQWPEKPDPYIVYHQTYEPGAGMYFWHVGNQQYQRLAAEQDAVFPVYMGFRSFNPVGPATLGAAWTTIDWYTTEIPPRGFITDLANGLFTLLEEGVFFIQVNVNFEHNEINQGRTTQLRLYNVTDDVETIIAIIPTGRNQAATTVTAGVALDIGPAGEGDVYRVDIGNGDDYSAITWRVSSISIFNVSERR